MTHPEALNRRTARTGLPDMAAAGELTLLVGAQAQELARAQPVLDAFSKQTIHFGAVAVYKLMINLQGAIQIAASWVSHTATKVKSSKFIPRAATLNARNAIALTLHYRV